MYRRHFIKTSVSLAAGGIPAPATRLGESSSGPGETLRIGYLPITDATPLLIAHAQGMYREEGLTVEPPSLIRNWSALVEAFLTNKYNVVHLLLPIPIWMRFHNKFPVKIVAWNHLNGSALTVGNHVQINSFEQLRGKSIAVPYWYSMHNVILQMGLRQAGITAVIKPRTTLLKDNEANLFLLPPPEMPNALAARKIDAYIVAEPFNALGELKINAKILRFTGDMWKNHPCCVVVMKEELIESDPIFTQKVVNAVVRSQQWILKHPGETARILSKDGKGYLPMPGKVLERVFTAYDPAQYGKGNLPEAIRHPDWRIGRIGFQPYPYPSATRFILQQLRQTLVQGDNSFLRTLDVNRGCQELVTDRFVKKALDELGGPGIFPDMNIESPWEREEVIDI